MAVNHIFLLYKQIFGNWGIENLKKLEIENIIERRYNLTKPVIVTKAN